MIVRTADLEALAGKYRELAEMRRAETRAEPFAAAVVYRRLARTFPGALKELDRLALTVLDERGDALSSVASTPAQAAPWMLAALAYHGFVRGALAARRAARDMNLDRDAPVIDDGVRRAAEHAATFAIDDGELEAILARGACRLVPIGAVFAAKTSGLALADVEALLALKPSR